MNRYRLKTLADYLRAMKPEQLFNMLGWAYCGCPSCAGGHACVLFHDDGLTLQPVRSILTPHYAGELGFRALAKFFGLSHYETDRIFDTLGYDVPDDEITPAMVADRVEEILEADRVENA